ncbi:Gfo/Idh/MocA family protein [Candidatus Planktophila versatilis]|uniref:Gfo/Idh/MocA family protein n=1 Tax=Candidatus Planktophila versatilis TaxID=1884905 RepID=UPI000BACC644|nr:Gfo/Idh/MocA family oxidoreductase [Candidatus Planktophila versatilis]ASY26123.1 dehydrogenase [Candidatus Planktophila versatilis]
MTSTRWGLLGAGWIATKAIAPAMHAASGAIVQAVASRDSARSRALNPVTIHESYEALINDPLVDAVYISLPNHLHCQWSVAALKAGKHVLCEKPFAINSSEVELMVKTARENDRLLVEAVWSRWHPRMARLVDYVKAGNIGKLHSIESSFTFPANIDGNYRLSPAMGGGALFDVGVYPLHAMAALVGDNAQVEIQNCDVTMGPTGIDLTTSWQLRFAGSITAQGVASFELSENQSLIVHGSKGSVELIGSEAFTSWNSPSQLRLGEKIEEFDAVDPYQLMIENFGKKVQGQESWVLPLETSLFVQRALDQLRARF